MPKQDDDIFKFDPTSFWSGSPHHEDVNYIAAVNQQTGAIVLIPASKLKAQSEQEIIKQVDLYHYRHNLYKNDLKPEHIEKTVQWLREESSLLNLVARQLSFHLIKLYEHLIKIHFKETQGQSKLEWEHVIFFGRKIKPCIMGMRTFSRSKVMTPAEKVQLDKHVQGIAKILYADADKSQMTNLGQIESGIRSQLQEQVSPQLGVF
jgi:type I restriction-modification system DNA methylase subunit